MIRRLPGFTAIATATVVVCALVLFPVPRGRDRTARIVRGGPQRLDAHDAILHVDDLEHDVVVGSGASISQPIASAPQVISEVGPAHHGLTKKARSSRVTVTPIQIPALAVVAPPGELRTVPRGDSTPARLTGYLRYTSGRSPPLT